MPKVCSEWQKPIRFLFGANDAPYDYMPHGARDTGGDVQTGFGVEFAKALCTKYELKCEIIRHRYEECWASDDYPGRALYGGGFHACSTYVHTHLRQASMDFGRPLAKRRPAGMLTRLENGKPVVSANSDLKNKLIGVVGGWAADEASLRHLKNGCTDKSFSPDKVIPIKDPNQGPDEAMAALLNGTVDAVYTFADILDTRRHCEFEGCNKELYSGLGKDYAWIHTGITEYQSNGTTLSMAPKGSSLNSCLDPLIGDFLTTEDYAELCRKYDSQGVQCFRNDYYSTGRGNLWSMDNKNRMEFCSDSENEEDCNSCAAGYCPCEN